MLSQFIEAERTKRKMTQSFVAKALGVSRPTYMQIEQGGRDITVTEARKLAELFDMPLERLLSETEARIAEVTLPPTARKKTMHTTTGKMRVNVPQKDLKKFKEVFLYILSKVGGKPNVGETVLYKLLYFVDFDYYEKFERQLIGATYIKNHFGPTPVEFKKIIERMQAEGEIETVKSKYFEHEQRKYLARREPELSVISGEEKAHIDDVLARLSDKNAKELSEYSHKDVPWAVAKMGEPIEYEHVFYRTDEFSRRPHEAL